MWLGVARPGTKQALLLGREQGASLDELAAATAPAKLHHPVGHDLTSSTSPRLGCRRNIIQNTLPRAGVAAQIP